MDSPIEISDIKQQLIIGGLPSKHLTIDRRIEQDTEYVYVDADIHTLEQAFHQAQWVYLIAGNSLFHPQSTEPTTGYKIHTDDIEHGLLRVRPIDNLPVAALTVYLSYFDITSHEVNINIDEPYPCPETTTELTISIKTDHRSSDGNTNHHGFLDAIAHPHFNRLNKTTASISVADAREVIYNQMQTWLEKLAASNTNMEQNRQIES